MKNNTILYSILFSLIILNVACKKYLDQKPDSSLAVPSSIDDLQLMLDTYGELNAYYPHVAEVLSDDYYTNLWTNLNEGERELYIWGDRLLAGNQFYWNNSYKSILNCNVVLDHIEKVKIEKTQVELKNAVHGSALFFRSYYYYGLAQLYSTPYNPLTAKQDLGIVLRKNSDFNVKSIRASNEDTYSTIINDLKKSISLLPIEKTSVNRPTKAAARSLLARVYLNIKQYDSAGYYAIKALEQNASLIDFNTLDANSNAPFSKFNKEIIFPMSSNLLLSRATLVDSTLFKSYSINDLRRSCYFHLSGNKIYQFKGNYDGAVDVGSRSRSYISTGITTDEIYLIKSECQARTGDIPGAIKTLNDLLVTRWKAGTYIPFTATNVNEALTHILRERRKELVFRTLRWEDLRRLKDDPLFSVTPKRIVNGQEYILPPNSPRYLLKIPQEVIQQSGIPQNP